MQDCEPIFAFLIEPFVSKCLEKNLEIYVANFKSSVKILPLKDLSSVKWILLVTSCSRETVVHGNMLMASNWPRISAPHTGTPMLTARDTWLRVASGVQPHSKY